jgi:hypothetical protein
MQVTMGNKRPKTPKAMLHQSTKRLGRSVFWRQYFVHILYKDLSYCTENTVLFQFKDHSGTAVYGNKSFLLRDSWKTHTVWVKCNVLQCTSTCTGRYTVNMLKYTWKCNRNSSMQPIKIKDKGWPCPRHKRVKEVQLHSFLTSALKVLCGQLHAPAALTPERGRGPCSFD